MCIQIWALALISWLEATETIIWGTFLFFTEAVFPYGLIMVGILLARIGDRVFCAWVDTGMGLSEI